MTNADIHIARWGDAGPAVILIHGSAQGSTVGGDRHFARQKALAERGWRMIVPDRPGHGASRDPGRPDDAEADAAWVVELIGDGAHLVGHSFGGAVALAAAARCPEKVRSLTVIEPAMQRFAADDPAVRRFAFKLMRAVLFSFSDVARAQRFAAAVGIPKAVDGGRPREELAAMGRGIRRLKVPAKDAIARELAVVRAAGIPLLAVTGGWNPGFDVVGARVAAAGGGEHIVIASPHHFPQSVSDEFNDRLDAFMRRAEVAAGGTA